MSEHRVSLGWKRTTPDFTYETYDRTHEVMFEGGQSLKASAAIEYKGNPAWANPEELLAASLSSCHMLTFLAIAAKSRLTLDSYEDEVTAVLEKNAEGRLSVTKIILRPKTRFSGTNAPDAAKIAELHQKAGHNCFIEASIKSQVIVEPRS
jgi:organic hydroperoxide reductase OsmC/OhrA